MPRERFGEDHTFLPRRAFLSFDEIEIASSYEIPRDFALCVFTSNVRSVVMRPGITVFIVIPCSATWFERVFMKPVIAGLSVLDIDKLSIG